METEDGKFVFDETSFFYCFVQTAWALLSGGAEYKPLQFLAFAFVYRIFEKLKASEPAVSPSFTVCWEARKNTYFFLSIFCFQYRIQRIWSMQHFAVIVVPIFVCTHIWYFILTAGRWWRFRTRYTDGKADTTISCSSVWMYCCFLFGISSFLCSFLLIVHEAKWSLLWPTLASGYECAITSFN